MAARRSADPTKTRAAVQAIERWLRDENSPAPSRAQLADAVRLTARTLADNAPGSSVEVRVPPFVAVQCIPGPAHRRGNPPNVIQTDPRTWLLLATGLLGADAATASGALQLSGGRASDVASWLPLVRLDGQLRHSPWASTVSGTALRCSSYVADHHHGLALRGAGKLVGYPFSGR